MKKIVLSLLLGFSLCFTCLTSLADDNSPAKSLSSTAKSNAVNPKTVDLTFTLSATHARLMLTDEGTQTYHLILTGITPFITYITSRPGRVAGLAELSNFIRAWTVGGNSFANNNPNAVLYAGVVNQAPNRANSFYLLQLAKPRFDKERGVLEFLAKPIGKHQTILSEMDYDYANLVIN
jgi:hypothetical protein